MRAAILFLDLMINRYPILGYSANPPAPQLSDQLKDWSITVGFGARFERVYGNGERNKTLLLQFEDV